MGTTMNGNRERLLDLMEMLDSAPFDVSWLRVQLQATHVLSEGDAAEVLRRTLARLDRAQFAISFAPPASEVEAMVHQRAIDWIATARTVLDDHSVS